MQTDAMFQGVLTAGKALSLSGEATAALELFTQATTLDPCAWEPQFLKAAELLKLEKVTEALPVFERALIFMPSRLSGNGAKLLSGIAQFYRGLTLLLIGDERAAVFSLKDALKEIPESQEDIPLTACLPESQTSEILRRLASLPLDQMTVRRAEDLLQKICTN